MLPSSCADISSCWSPEQHTCADRTEPGRPAAAHSVAVATCRPVGVADAVTGMTAASLLQVVSRCFQLMTSVFQAPPTVAVPYIRALGPPLVRFLQVLMLMV